MISMRFVLLLLLGIGASKATFSYWKYSTTVEGLPSKPKAARVGSRGCAADKRQCMKVLTLSLALGIIVPLCIIILEPSANVQQPKRATSSVEKKWGVAATVPESAKGSEDSHPQ